MRSSNFFFSTVLLPVSFVLAEKASTDLERHLPGIYKFLDYKKLNIPASNSGASKNCPNTILIKRISSRGGGKHEIDVSKDLFLGNDTCSLNPDTSPYLDFQKITVGDFEPIATPTLSFSPQNTNSPTPVSNLEPSSISDQTNFSQWYGYLPESTLTCKRMGLLPSLIFAVSDATVLMRPYLQLMGEMTGSGSAQNGKTFTITLLLGNSNCLYLEPHNHQVLSKILKSFNYGNGQLYVSPSPSSTLIPLRQTRNSPTPSPGIFPTPTKTSNRSPTPIKTPGISLSPTQTPPVSPTLPMSATVSPSPKMSASPSSETSRAPVSNGGVSCFPAAAKVELSDGSLVPMDKLQVGQSIRDASGAFSKVVFFAHASPDAESSFVHIQAGASDIILSPTHYIHTNGKLVPAANVQEGDIVLTLESNTTNPPVSAGVETISRVTMKGLFNPMTASGSIGVAWNGSAVIASTCTQTINPQLAQLLLSPLVWLDSKMGLTIPVLSRLFANGIPLLAALLPDGPIHSEL